MPIVNSRTREGGQPVINHETCTRCKQCIKVCPSEVLGLWDGQVEVDHAAGFDCIGCGQCMMVCPEDAIAVTGRCVSPQDLRPLDPDAQASPGQLAELYASRRSVRRFKKDPVKREMIGLVLKMAAQAPMGIPPSDVGVTVLDTPEKVHKLSEDIITAARYSKPVMKAMGTPLLRPIMMRGVPAEMIHTFLLPLIDKLVGAWDQGRDLLCYDAPAALLFHRSPFTDPVDGSIAATYAMLAAHSLGLGTVWIGTVPPYLSRSKDLLLKYRVPPGWKPDALLLLGHPAMKYRKGIQRTFAQVEFV